MSEHAADAAAGGPWPDRVNILGVGLSAANLPAAVERLEGWVEHGERRYVCVADVHVVMQGRWNPTYRAVLNGAGMTTTDGMPLVWLCRWARGRHVGRVYGPDLMLAACERGLACGRRHYFLGGAPGVAELLAERLQARLPGLEVAGLWSPPFRTLTPAEEDDMVARVNAARADYVWVGLGAPKQEFFMQRFRPRLDAPVLLGVGAAFDFHSGAKPQAPALVQRLGVEWLFRLASEPARLWPRYRRVVPGFLYHLALQASGAARYPLEDAAAGAR